jgi:hypothetical protein
MFVAARGCHTFTPNIFSTQRNAKGKREPSPSQVTAIHFDARDLVEGRGLTQSRSVSEKSSLAWGIARASY